MYRPQNHTEVVDSFCNNLSVQMGGVIELALPKLSHNLPTALSTCCEQRAVVGKDSAGGIVAGGAGDAAAGMGAGAAMVEAS
jgi:hypothetical protein